MNIIMGVSRDRAKRTEDTVNLVRTNLFMMSQIIEEAGSALPKETINEISILRDESVEILKEWAELN